MGEEFCTTQPVKPISGTLGLVSQSLELSTRPPNDIGIDPFQGRTQSRLVEVAIVGDPATDARVVHLDLFGQRFVATVMQRPAAYLAADARQRFRTSSGWKLCAKMRLLHPHDLSRLETGSRESQSGCREMA